MGTAIEWYDYGLYTIAAGLVISTVFFSGESEQVALLATYGAFAVGFVARPLGGIVLGAASDRFGRRPVLIFSLLLIGSATTIIGLLPGYDSIGIWAPLLLMLMRIVQGFAAGAEMAGAITIANESATGRRKSFLSSLAMGGAVVGVLTASVLFSLFSFLLPSDEFLSYGWRIPFVLSALFTVIGMFLRRTMEESPEFLEVERGRERGEVAQAHRNPLVAMAKAIKANPRNWFAGFLVPSGLNVTSYITSAFAIGYATSELDLPRSQSLLMTVLVFGSGFLGLLFFGRLGDAIGVRRVILIGIGGALALTIPYVALLKAGAIVPIIIASVALNFFGWAAAAAAHTVIMPALFHAENRSSALFSARELQGALVAGPAPLLATWLVGRSDGDPWSVAAILAVAQLMTLAGVFMGRLIFTDEERATTPALKGYTPPVEHLERTAVGAR
ncbi:MFS transporter [Actinomadura madurae]|uniref:MFS transporter n=1 Tax=Actinomadura madurae TaxID=1993 RepID=UPI0020D1F834|nr:MFS transporter [Actinomadura madurae]MCP9953586.1 MFS transporter [Actinomadura madurae]MCQ0005629.1 MFS transporter [Actinomadura madurae]